MTDGDPMTPRRALDVYGDEIEKLLPERMELGEERHGDAWKGADPDFLLDRSLDNLLDVDQVVNQSDELDDQDVRDALKQLADTVNFARMALAVRRWGDSG